MSPFGLFLVFMSLVSCVGGVDSCIGRFLVLVSVSCRARCLAFVLVVFCCCCIGRSTRCLVVLRKCFRKVVGGWHRVSKNCFFDQQLDFSFPLFLFVVSFVTHTPTHTHTIAKSNKKCNVHVLLHRAIFGQPKNTSLRIGLSGIGVNLSGDMDN